MSLAAMFQSQFPEVLRQRGEAYWRSGRVTVDIADDDYLYATVRGSREYDVDLDYEGNMLSVSCTCPYFPKAHQCKHIWACLLEADTRGALQPEAGQPLVLVAAEDDDDEDEDAEDFEGNDIEAFGDEDDFDLMAALTGSETFPPDLSRIMQSYRRAYSKPRRPAPPSWEDVLRSLQSATAERGRGAGASSATPDRLIYVIDVPQTFQNRGLLALQIHSQRMKLNGEWGKPTPARVDRGSITQLADQADRDIFALLFGSTTASRDSYYMRGSAAPSTHLLDIPITRLLLPRLAATERLYIRISTDSTTLTPLRFDDGPPWKLRLTVRADQGKGCYRATGALQRGEEQADLSEPALLHSSGWVFWADRFARLDDANAFDWVGLLRDEKCIEAPLQAGAAFVAAILSCAAYPELDLPAELQFEEVAVPPVPALDIVNPSPRNARGRLQAQLAFDYDGTAVPPDDVRRGVLIPGSRRVIQRDFIAEKAAADRLIALNLKPAAHGPDGKRPFELSPRHLPRAVAALVAEGWRVQAEGKLYRVPGAFTVGVSSGIDWFDLHAEVEYDDVRVGLPQLLSALKRNENRIVLDDGTIGMIPEEWLKRYGPLARTGKIEGDHIRFQRCQAFILDALLEAQPEATCDEAFLHLRDELRHTERLLAPVAPTPDFRGTLREYQSQGLGWMLFLNRVGFGGCLADDMGLGKTVQVLALFDHLYAARNGEPARPSLVVVPRSLVLNWLREAERFAPRLRVLDNTGSDRGTTIEDLAAYDVVLATYGTLRQDIVPLKEVPFEYAILDEAQAIKNASTVTAKAARLIQARHRLALSGTPVENHLGELWSLLEFLNPGMLGTASVFRSINANGRDVDEAAHKVLSRALRPFILRRTKAQVAADLPEKQEDTLYCELDAHERRYYDELRLHYRETMLKGKSDADLRKSKVQILTALLRLRQAACHPGLIDARKRSRGSAKLDCLLPQLEELIEEGHKALVFSQFTTLLAILRSRLDKRKIAYEYLDGQTRDRQAPVDRFQQNPDCPLFLISLKAGGLGLNLTAAEYVYLLDPWWNPAVETQAIDRTHRIGQTRPVFAYRLIARNTVEEKVLELQQRKRDLADAILGRENGPASELTREDLELLLS